MGSGGTRTCAAHNVAERIRESLHVDRDEPAHAAENVTVLRRIRRYDVSAGSKSLRKDESLRFRYARHHESVGARIEFWKVVARHGAEKAR